MKTTLSIIVLAFFFLAAVGSGSSSSTTNSSQSGSSWDAYSIPVSPSSGACGICGGRGYTLRNGVKETCYPCNGTGKAVSFPETK